MSEITHSQGPWSVQENAYGKVFIYGGKTLVAPTGFEYKELIAGGNSHDTLTLANARLIAAAPDLLAALKHARANMPHPDMMADEAIAKAEGRSNG